MSGLATGLRQGLGAVERAYAEQCAAVEDEGGQVVLMSSRELARMENGDLEVASKPGRGSTFTLTLPLSGKPAAPSPTFENAPGLEP